MPYMHIAPSLSVHLLPISSLVSSPSPDAADLHLSNPFSLWLFKLYLKFILPPLLYLFHLNNRGNELNHVLHVTQSLKSITNDHKPDAVGGYYWNLRKKKSVGSSSQEKMILSGQNKSFSFIK